MGAFRSPEYRVGNPGCVELTGGELIAWLLQQAMLLVLGSLVVEFIRNLHMGTELGRIKLIYYCF